MVATPSLVPELVQILFQLDELYLAERSPIPGTEERMACKPRAIQNVNVSSSAIMITGGPPDDIFAALANVALPPADAAHC
jgi:hypothetical protein